MAAAARRAALAASRRRRFYRPYEQESGGIVTGRRQVETKFGAFCDIEIMRDLHQHTGAVTDQWIGADGTTMGEIFQNLQAIGNNGMRGLTLHMGDKADAACVVVVAAIIEPGGIGFKGRPSVAGEVAIGYDIVRPHRRRGLAVEGTAALMRWAFLDSQVGRVLADCRADNIASVGVLRRLGFAELPGNTPAMLRWEMPRSLWQRRGW